MLRLDQLIQDGRFALRQLVRSPLVAAVAILTLAIGIGLNTAVFTLVSAVLLRPLPYPHSERLIWIAPYSEQHKQESSRHVVDPVAVKFDDPKKRWKKAFERRP